MALTPSWLVQVTPLALLAQRGTPRQVGDVLTAVQAASVDASHRCCKKRCVVPLSEHCTGPTLNTAPAIQVQHVCRAHNHRLYQFLIPVGEPMLSWTGSSTVYNM